jgi:hypothetical protein
VNGNYSFLFAFSGIASEVFCNDDILFDVYPAPLHIENFTQTHTSKESKSEYIL